MSQIYKKDKSDNSYGVQETSSAEDKADFYSILEEEILRTFEDGRMLCLEIQGDPHEMSANGKLLMCLVDRYNLVVVNGTEKCSVVITRMRKKGNNVFLTFSKYANHCTRWFQKCTLMKVEAMF